MQSLVVPQAADRMAIIWFRSRHCAALDATINNRLMTSIMGHIRFSTPHIGRSMKSAVMLAWEGGRHPRPA